MADFNEIANCVSKETFVAKIKVLQESLKTNKSSVNVFVEEEFYHRVHFVALIRSNFSMEQPGLQQLKG